MTVTSIAKRGSLAATLLGLVALAMVNPLVLADEVDELVEEEFAEEMIDEIRVEGPRLVERERLPAGRGQRVSMSFSVVHDDLDLSRVDDVRELEERIELAAKMICEHLHEMYPRGTPDLAGCISVATTDAMEQAEAAIAAAIGAE